jgi:hypothetical protein
MRQAVLALIVLVTVTSDIRHAAAAAPRSLAEAQNVAQQTGLPILAVAGRDT